MFTSAPFGAPLVLVAVCIAGPGHAQTGRETQALEEITVTAERREASLQDTAIAITAFSGEELLRSGIETSEQLSGFTPGLNIQRDVIGKVVIRGIGTENFTIAGDPGVAIAYDGGYIARSSVAIFDLFDLERVEVLRGPQGTLYGRNATGGAINFISRKPTDEFELSFLGDVGDYGKTRFEGAISGPIAEDRLLGRLSAMIHERDGYTDNVFPNVGRGLDELDTKDLWAARGQLRWLASDRVTVDIKADVYRDDSNPIPYKYVADPLIYFGGVPFPNPLADQLRTVSQGFELDIPGFDLTVPDEGTWDQTGLQATVDWELSPGLALRSITAYREIEFDWLNDGDGIEAYLVNYFQSDESEQLTQEFQLVSDGDGRFNWVAGLFFLTEDAESFIGIPLPLGADLPLAILINGESETTAYAAFGEASYYLTDRLRLTLGARFSREEKEVDYFDDRSSLGGPAAGFTGDESWSAFTPKLGLDYFVNDDVMLYGSLTNGFKSGGFNLLAIQPSYDEEEVWSFETGIKSRFADGRVQLNAAAFYYAYDDLQVGKIVNLNAVIENAAEATIYGAEVELRALVTDEFQVDASLSLLETEYDEFVTEDKDLPGAPEVSLAGNELPRAPGVTGSLSGLYTIPLGNGGAIELWGNWQYTGSQFFTPFNRASFEQDGYDLLNARVTYVTPSGRWQFSLYGENLGDEEYFTNALESGVPTPGVDRVVPQFFVGAPRMWGFRFRYLSGG
jgi:iron complex outermembrane receptor protein